MKRGRVFLSIFSFFVVHTTNDTECLYGWMWFVLRIHPPTWYLLIHVAHGLVCIKTDGSVALQISPLIRHNTSWDIHFALTPLIPTFCKRNLLLVCNWVKRLQYLLLKTNKWILLMNERRNIFHCSSYLIKSDNNNRWFSCLAWTRLNKNLFLNIWNRECKMSSAL